MPVLSATPVPNKLWVASDDDQKLGLTGSRSYHQQLVQGFRGLTKDGYIEGKYQDGWNGAQDDFLPAIKMMLDLYPDKKYYVIADDDTYLFLNNLAEHLLEIDSDDSVRKRKSRRSQTFFHRTT